MFAALKIGHADQQGQTGITVFLFSKAIPMVYHLCGSAPGTRDILLLSSETVAEGVHGLVFTGGSAFGLGATNGVMQWLAEQGQGFYIRSRYVPLVPTACIFDLSETGDLIIPTAELAYRACERATTHSVAEGRVGAGTGATVGKCVPMTTCSPGGYGQAIISQGALSVMACVVVNAIGDVMDAAGNIVAGAKNEAGEFVSCRNWMLQKGRDTFSAVENTTLVALFTNARITHSQLKQLAKMAQSGLARSIAPVFTPFDGDIIFAASFNEVEASSLITLGEMAISAIIEAVHRAVKK